MTWGELGTGNLTNSQPEFVKSVRKQEFEQAMLKLGFFYHSLGFADLGLSFVNLEVISTNILEVIRLQNLAAVFSFAPDEYSWGFDHPDHTVSGQATRVAAASADVANFHPEIEVVSERPELYWRVTDKKRATHALGLSKKSRQRRDRYLEANYPSQFTKDSQQNWSGIFDRINQTKKRKSKQKEYYLRIR